MSFDPSKLPPPPPRQHASEQSRLVLKIGQPKAQEAMIKEASELQAWQQELKEKEQALRLLEAQLLDRESYIENCENDLLDRSMQLTKREAHVEQREDNHEADVTRFNAA